MILLAGSPDIDASPPALTDASRRAPDRKRGPRNQAWAPPGECCLRCGGLLVPSYLASLESDLTGRPMRRWRCVNCGDCVDSDILANRWEGPVPARETMDWRANIVFPQPVREGRQDMTKPRILLADDHPEVLAALRGILDELGEVVGMVTDGQALVEAARRLQPDLIISDISMPRLNGLDATRALQTCAPQSKVIILTVHREALYVSLAFKAGARGYLLKRSAVAELPQAVLHVLAGERYIGQDVGGREEWASADGDEATTWRPEL